MTGKRDMKKYIVYNDVHLFGPHEIDLEAKMLLESDEALYLGDNVDMNHVRKNDIDYAKDTLWSFAELYEGRFCPGNHELDFVPGHRSYVTNGICFEHGDYLFWGEEKRAKYMANKKPGANWFMRMFIIATFDSLRKFWPAKYDDDFKQRAYLRAKEMKCNTIVMGHKHPTNMADFMHIGVRIIVLPRGRNELEL